jgi:ribonuclease P protein component
LPGGAERAGSASRSDAPATGQRFPRSHRLTRRRQYVEAYDKGCRASSASFTIYGLANDLGHSRLGLTVTRKIGNAVVRNRIKRMLRDVFRRRRQELAAPLDLVVNVKPSILRQPADHLEREFLATVAAVARRARG